MDINFICTINERIATFLDKTIMLVNREKVNGKATLTLNDDMFVEYDDSLGRHCYWIWDGKVVQGYPISACEFMNKTQIEIHIITDCELNLKRQINMPIKGINHTISSSKIEYRNKKIKYSYFIELQYPDDCNICMECEC